MTDAPLQQLPPDLAAALQAMDEALRLLAARLEREKDKKEAA